MERLTEKHYGASDYYMTCSGNCANDAEMCGGCPWLEKIINRLGAYEDTGLEPGEIVAAQKAMRAALALACELQAFKNLGPFDHLRELVQAERAGRLVVLPWAIGQTIYEADADHGVVKHTLLGAVWCMNSTAVDDSGNTWPDFWCSENESLAHMTREEAEAALEGGTENAM